MTSRSVVLGTAALLLLSAAAPIQFGFSPTAAIAQEVSDELRAAFSGKPGQLSPEELRTHIKVLREAMDSGIFKEPGRKAAEQKIEAYSRALQRHRDQRREASEEPGQPRQGERTRRQRSERDAERQAQQRQAEQRQPRSGLSPAMEAALDDNRPASELDRAELINRVQALHAAANSGALTRDQRDQVQSRLQADSSALQAGRQTDEAERADQGRREQRRQRQRRRAEPEVPQQQIEERARSIIADDTPATDMRERDLRKRLADNRELLATGQLSDEEERVLRRQLREDREEVRARVASRQRQADEPETRRERRSPPRASIIVEDRTPSDQLSERDLERRVRALNRALEEERLARRDAERARDMVERDRRELRRRLHAERERRRERRREARSRDDVIIDFNIGQRAPQVIFAAEAMPHDIEAQLVAPPSRPLSRSYSVAEISRNHEVREAMPGIEIDTLNFDFGSAEVRPEEIDKLDEIAYVIERIVAARPDEVFLIEGHTDAVGSDAANQVLSQRRARAVYEALLDYYAIDPHNLQTVGLGERFLKIWTEYPEEENRRVTIRRITPLLMGGRG